ncbi:TetR family transcriptional regulator [Streptomyces abyssalis]|uniref:TetR family transcriptional regulator n=1 Tax=Streptomyces abyssalis TaxID=933944 RepID=A0A1E7JK39_9ACTN|nr:TetR family transcriptional regulator [Streptomyces abyssalis]OEU88010.1 TetR family transcriptional regulator [Streptomyces abyssalis]OEU90872.1 TetR family transcriptional regulator [Streptomyces abyssalis]OEV06110.1 TetR family transcriptional regulator [Streptomyces nanshensis]
MVSEALTAERVLEATEEVLRRYGPSKATVVDVARALGVSHGSVYRHFRTKAALREAVTQRWLDRTSELLTPVVDDSAPAEERLDRWLTRLFEAKRHKAGGDPELFATYSVLTGDMSAVVDRHIGDLVGQLARIIEDGRREGVFASDSVGFPTEAARAVFQATGRFHDPAYAAEWSRPGIDEDFAAVRTLVIRGLRA